MIKLNDENLIYLNHFYQAEGVNAWFYFGGSETKEKQMDVSTTGVFCCRSTTFVSRVSY